MAIKVLTVNAETPAITPSPRIIQNDIRVDFPTGVKHTIVRRKDGVYAIVAPASGTVTIDSMTPAFVDGSRKMNGAMLNMAIADDTEQKQPFDSLLYLFPFEGALRASFPLEMSVGDILVCANSDPHDELESGDAADRWGVATSWASFEVVASAPNPDFFAQPALTWPGKTPNPDGIDIDVGAFVDSLPSFSDANQPDIPSFVEIYGQINRHAPVPFFNLQKDHAYRHYQGLLPYSFNGDPTQTNANHGEFSSETINRACLALISDHFTRDQKIDIAVALISHGIQWGDPHIEDGNQIYRAEGAHWQVMQGAVAVARAARGLDMSSLLTTVGGNWKDAFVVTQSDIDAVTDPHGDVAGLPPCTRKRTIATVEGNTIGVNVDRGSTTDPVAISFDKMEMVRVSDSAVATVQSGFVINNLQVGDPPLEGVIDGQPTEGDFLVGQEVYFRPTFLAVGQYAWADAGSLERWSPSSNAPYMNQQNYAGAVITCHAAKWFEAAPDGFGPDPLFPPVVGYVHTSLSADMPTAQIDYPPAAQTAWEIQFFKEHEATIFSAYV